MTVTESETIVFVDKAIASHYCWIQISVKRVDRFSFYEDDYYILLNIY